jgi:hypothetical protein
MRWNNERSARISAGYAEHAENKTGLAERWDGRKMWRRRGSVGGEGTALLAARQADVEKLIALAA